MKIDVLANFVHGYMQRGGYTHVLWDDELMDEHKFVEKARQVIFCEPPADLTSCINDVLDQVKFLTQDEANEFQFGKLENVNDLMEFKAQVALEKVVCNLESPEHYECKTYFELFTKLMRFFADPDSCDDTSKHWDERLDVYAEIEEREYTERFYELRNQYEDVTYLLYCLKRRPEALSWLINEKGLNDE